MTWLYRFGVVALFFTVGCTDPDPNADDDTSSTASMAGGSDATGGNSAGGSSAGGNSAGGNTGNGGAGNVPCDPDSAYPAGPYGNAVGDVVANVQLRGYRNDLGESSSIDEPVVDYSLNDVRRTCKGFALVHLSDYT